MSAFIDLVGPTLSKGKETINTADALAGKTAVALYFSAHWCPPCRGFTPKLAEMYKDALQAKGLEIIFVSSDRDEGAFDDYYAEQPWLALPYAARDLKAKLSKKYKVSGIPSLVVLDGATGATITTDGREAVMEDPKGENLPWKPPSFWDALGTEFLKGTEGETVEVDELKGKVIGLYFSAHWCPPCRGFTPALVKAYTEHLQAKNCEIIFVSSDRSASDFQSYYATMPWLAIPHGDKRKALLSSRFGVSGIPSFVLVDGSTGETITTEARSNVSADPSGAEFPWFPKPVVDLTSGSIGPLNEETCLCVLMEDCAKPAVQAAVADVLTPLAEAAKAAGDDTCFFYAGSVGGPTEQIRQLTSLAPPSKGVPQMILLDIPDNGGFYTSDATEVTAETVKAFLEAYKAGSLERKQLA